MEFEAVMYTVALALLAILWVVNKVFSKKLKEYEDYVKYIMDILVVKADEMYVFNESKHSWVAEKIWSILPKFIKAFITPTKIDKWIHDRVHALREKQALSMEMTTKAITKTNPAIDNEHLKSLAEEIRKETKITIEPNINLEKFKKSTIGIRFEKIF